MRTTVTLDPDTERLLRNAMRDRGVSFKEALNKAIRDGLTRPAPRGTRYVQKSYSLGAEQLFPWNKTLAVAAALEDDEIARKLSLRK